MLTYEQLTSLVAHKTKNMSDNSICHAQMSNKRRCRERNPVVQIDNRKEPDRLSGKGKDMAARGRKKASSKSIESLTHEEARRTNLPSAEHQSLMRDEEQKPFRRAYERRNRDLDPQLVWRGKDQQDQSDLVVNVPPLYIQERIHPKALIDDLVGHQPGALRPAVGVVAGHRPLTTDNSTCLPTSTACPPRTPGPSSTGTTPTGPTA